MKNFDELFSELLLLEDPMDKYEWIIDYGGSGYGIPDSQKIDVNLVHGCTSRLWVIKSNDNIFCEADSVIVDGFASMICDWWNQASEEQRSNFSITDLATVGLMPLLSMGRQNGVANLISKLRTL